MTETKQLGGAAEMILHNDRVNTTMTRVARTNAPVQSSLLGNIFGQHTAEEQISQIQLSMAGRRNALQTGIAAGVHLGDRRPVAQRVSHLDVRGGTPVRDCGANPGALEKRSCEELPVLLAEMKCKTAMNNARTNVLADYLMGHHLTEVASNYLDKLRQHVNEDRSLAMSRADDLVTRGKWPELVKALIANNWGDAEYLRCGLLARAYRELRKPAEATSAWQAATTAATDQPQSLARLAVMADDWGWQQEHDTALWSIARRFPMENWALESLRQSYAARCDTLGLQAVYTLLVSRNPRDLAAKNNLATILLLTESHNGIAHELAWEVYAASPGTPAYAATYAWSLHLSGMSGEGLLILGELPKSQLEEPTVALYYGALLAVAGRQDKARVYLGIAESGSLLREERTLLAQAKTRLAGGMRAGA